MKKMKNKKDVKEEKPVDIIPGFVTSPHYEARYQQELYRNCMWIRTQMMMFQQGKIPRFMFEALTNKLFDKYSKDKAAVNKIKETLDSLLVDFAKRKIEGRL